MDKDKELSIADEYSKFVSIAVGLARDEVELYPLAKHELKRDRYTEHLIGMLHMYSVRYGDADQRLEIVEFLEQQLFRKNPMPDEVCHLTFDMWQDLRKSILAGEYKDTKDKSV